MKKTSLMIEGRAVRSATGPNDQPGGSEELGAASWDVAEFAGKAAIIEIVDQATGSWGGSASNRESTKSPR